MNEHKSAETEMKRYFVTFLSPGTFVAESSTKQVESWDIEAAKSLAQGIEERYGATPYGFYFHTMERAPGEWEPRRTATSPTYYLPHCKVETYEEVVARNHPDEQILRDNMRMNDIKRIVVATKGWKWTQPLNDSDVVLT